MGLDRVGEVFNIFLYGLDFGGVMHGLNRRITFYFRVFDRVSNVDLRRIVLLTLDHTYIRVIVSVIYWIFDVSLVSFVLI